MKNLLEEKDIALKILKELNKLVTIPDRGFFGWWCSCKYNTKDEEWERYTR